MTSKQKACSIIALLLLAPVFTASPSNLFAHKGATGIVKERMDLMKRYDELIDRLFAIVHGELPYSEKIVHNAALEIKETAGAQLTKLFPEGSTQKPSVAAPAIWDDIKMFSHMADRLQDLAAALESSAAEEPGNADSLPKKWEDVPAMGAGMGKGGMMMGQGRMMMGGGMMAGPRQSWGGGTMEQNLWHVAHVCNSCHVRFRAED